MRSRRKITVVSVATTSTTNITGFLAISLGSSLTKAEPIAGHTIFGSSMVATGIRLLAFCTTSMEVTPSDRSEQGVGAHRQVLDDRAERERREEGETADDEDDADDETDEQAPGCRQRAGRGWNRFLASERARHRHRRDDHEETADEHRASECQIIEERVAGEPAKRRAVIARCRRVGVEHFRKAVRTGIVHRSYRRWQHHGDCGPDEIHQRKKEDGEHRPLDLARLA